MMFDIFKPLFSEDDNTENNNHLKITMNGNEFRQRLEKGDREFKDLLLTNVNLRGLNLRNLVLIDSTLQGGDLSYACLFNSNFSRTKLDRTNFTGSFLDGANFFKASLVGANFSRCQAKKVKLAPI
jgi:uncharacterized protein YjbI with pentapeptide repeats